MRGRDQHGSAGAAGSPRAAIPHLLAVIHHAAHRHGAGAVLRQEQRAGTAKQRERPRNSPSPTVKRSGGPMQDHCGAKGACASPWSTHLDVGVHVGRPALAAKPVATRQRRAVPLGDVIHASQARKDLAHFPVRRRQWRAVDGGLVADAPVILEPALLQLCLVPVECDEKVDGLVLCDAEQLLHGGRLLQPRAAAR